jgi:hypothetical protein
LKISAHGGIRHAVMAAFPILGFGLRTDNISLELVTQQLVDAIRGE